MSASNRTRVKAKNYDTVARRRVLVQLGRARAAGAMLVPPTHRDAMWLRRHAQLEGIIEPEHNLFVAAEDWKAFNVAERAKLMIEGLSVLHPAWSFWGYDAALVWGLEVPYPLVGPRYLVLRNKPSLLKAPVRLLRPDACPPCEVHEGVYVTGLWRTVEDCLLRAQLSVGLAIADSALRRTDATREDLMQGLREHASKRRGIRRALCIARYADGLSENGGESRFRAFFIVYGFSVPRLQVEFVDPFDPEKTFRVDYLWVLEDGTQLIGELDGLDKYYVEHDGAREVSIDAFAAERLRESHLTMLGHKVLRFSFSELKEPEKLIEKLERAGVPRSKERANEWCESWYGV